MLILIQISYHFESFFKYKKKSSLGWKFLPTNSSRKGNSGIKGIKRGAWCSYTQCNDWFIEALIISLNSHTDNKIKKYSWNINFRGLFQFFTLNCYLNIDMYKIYILKVHTQTGEIFLIISWSWSRQFAK